MIASHVYELMPDIQSQQKQPVIVKPPPVSTIPSKQQPSTSSVVKKNDSVKPAPSQGVTPSQVKDPPGAVSQVS